MFKNRSDAAQQLATYLQKYRDNPEVVIVAIPRGALEIGVVLAQKLHAPLDIALVKKIGAPENPEFAIGALSLTTQTIDPMYSHLTEHITQELQEKRALLKKRQASYYTNSIGPISLHNKIVILVDDGIATGRTFLETIKLIKTQKPQRIIAAIPVAPPDTLAKIQLEVDELICILQPNFLQAIGQFYQDFAQVEDAQAIKLLHDSSIQSFRPHSQGTKK